MCEPLWPEIPFSLACMNCDTGDQVFSYDQAITGGWSDISYEPDLPMANYLGLCPLCREEWEKVPESPDRQ